MKTKMPTFRTNRLVGLVAALLASSSTPDIDARLLISPSALDIVLFRCCCIDTENQLLK
jgi:predicted ATP-grasp superfamily ATP-dependent carboligase